MIKKDILNNKFYRQLSKFITINYPNKRKSKYSNYYFIKNIFYVLKTGIQWKDLKIVSHYTTIYKKFVYWNDLNVFDMYYKHIQNEYIKTVNIRDTYIDSSHIRNISGCDMIGRNHYDRFRNSTKLHLIIDSNRIPLSYTLTQGNVNDNVITEQLTGKLSKIIDMDKRKTINLIGDKGYVNYKLAEKLKPKHINLLTPLKKNNKYVSNKTKHNNKLKKI